MIAAVLSEVPLRSGSMKTYKIQPGWRYPFGVTVDATGVNFSIWGQRATSAELLLYERARSTTPFQVIRLDPNLHRTFYRWHVYVEGLPAGGTCEFEPTPGDTDRCLARAQIRNI